MAEIAIQSGNGADDQLVVRAARRRLLSMMAGVVQGLLVAVAAAVFVGLALLPRLGLYRPVTVLTGSMRPTFAPGDMIIVRPEPLRDIRVGQVISYQVPVGAHQVETHRVLKLLRGGAHPIVRTQGDANNAPDPWVARLNGSTAWRLSVVIPYGGYVVNTLRSRTMHAILVLVVPALLALLMLAKLWGIGGRRRPRTGDAHA